MNEAKQVVRNGAVPMLAAVAVSLGLLIQATTIAGATNSANSGIDAADSQFSDAAASQLFEKKKKKKKTLRGTQTRGSFTDD